MNYLKKIIPLWLGIGISNAVTIPLIINKKSETPKSMINLIIPKPITKVAERPKNKDNREINRNNYIKCLKRADERICASKHYFGN